MMLRHPAGKGAGTVCEEFVYTTDVPATVIDAAGVTFHDRLDGHSLLPVAEGTRRLPLAGVSHLPLRQLRLVQGPPHLVLRHD